jgi:hypothetical protein
MTNTKQSPTGYFRQPIAAGVITKLDLPSNVRAFRVVQAPLVDALFLIGEGQTADGLGGIPMWSEPLLLTNGATVYLDARNTLPAGSGVGDLVLETYSDANVAKVPEGPIFDAGTVTQYRFDQNLTVLAGARRTLYSQNDNTLHTRWKVQDQRRSGSLYFAGEVWGSQPFSVALISTQTTTTGETLLAPLVVAGANLASGGGFVANLYDGWPGRKLVPIAPCKVEYISTGPDGVCSYRLGFLSR